jgi:hypothetical protein
MDASGSRDVRVVFGGTIVTLTPEGASMNPSAAARFFLHVVTMALILAAADRAHSATVYSQDFESGVLGAEFSGAGSIQGTGGLSAFGFGAQHLKNDGALVTTLAIPGILAPHTSMTLAFSLAMWDSIDYPTDTFQVTANGTFVINEGFGNYFPASGSEGPGTRLTPATNGDFTDPQYGYNSGFRDSARAVSITFAHSAPAGVLTFQFPNSQSAPDESFGIDNILVSTNAVAAIPEPSTYALMLAGLGIVGWAARRRKSRS